METWNAITSRRNVREYRDEPIPPDDLDRVLEAARRAPSSRNWQPWDFVVVTDRDRLGELAAAGEYAAHVPGSAATIALVMRDYDDPDERETARFGDALLPGGAMHQGHLEFLEWASSYDDGPLDIRSRRQHEAWMASLPCPLTRIEGDRTNEERIGIVMEALAKLS